MRCSLELYTRFIDNDKKRAGFIYRRADARLDFFRRLGIRE